MKNNNKTLYEMTWRNKWLTSDAKSAEDMIASFNGAIEEIVAMKNDGLEFEFQSATDDYIFLYTADKIIADKYGMEEVAEFDDEEIDNDNDD